MNTKLTLKLDSRSIKKAKEYANNQETSLSRLVESYFNFLTKDKKQKEEKPLLVRELSGIIKLPNKFNYKKEYKKHIIEKYSKNG